jgi:uncharacterized protein with von Willebrand factor type A (vWA) domain
VPFQSKKLLDELREWLKDPLSARELDADERAMLEALDLETLERQFEERAKEQRERHDGGNRWIGSGGTSPFGQRGVHPTGKHVGDASGTQKSAMAKAAARNYRAYRSDLLLDVRQMEVALKKLRAFAREGAERELDIEGTIDRSARNAGELEIVTRPPRRSNTRVILMMDAGGSMDPHAAVVSQLFSAATRATHFRELRTYYFHNCVYGEVYETEGFRDAVKVRELVQQCGKQYRLVLVGDASMASYELFGGGGEEPARRGNEDAAANGFAWLQLLRTHFERSVWLNPDSPTSNHYTVSAIRELFPMFALTIDGLGQAVRELIGSRVR